MARLKTIDGETHQWHRQQAARARTNSQWEASLFHWNHAIELQSDDPGQYWDRSWMKMYLAQWAGAAADLGQAVEGNPKSIDMHFHRLAALLIADDVTGYRDARTQMIQRFEQPGDWFVAYLAARMAALAPGTPDEAAQMLRFADTMLKTHSTHPSSLHTVAIANYRAGRIELAAEKAHAALVAKPDWNAQVLNHLVLALAYNKLHNATEARRHYDEAMKWIETAQALPIAQNPQRLGLHSVDWLTCLVLRREAETELGIEPKVILPH